MSNHIYWNLSTRPLQFICLLGLSYKWQLTVTNILFALRSPLAAPIGDSWKLDPRWDVFNHFKTLYVIVLYSECVGCRIEVKIVKFSGME